MSNDTIAQRKAHAIEKLTNDRDNAIKRAEDAEARAADLLEANREQAEALATLRAERDHWIDAYKAQEAGYNAAVAGASKFAQQRDDLRLQLEQAHRKIAALSTQLGSPVQP